MRKNSQSGAVFVLVLLLVLIIAGLVLFILIGVKNSPVSFSQKTAKTGSTLPVYYSRQFGFEFRYPLEFTVQNDSEEDYSKRGQTDFRKNFTDYVGYEPPKLIKAVAVLGKDNSYDPSPFTVWVFANPDSLDTFLWYDKYWYYPFMWGIFAKEHKYMPSLERQATVSGQFVQYRLLSYQNGAPEYFYFSHKGNMILLRSLTTKNSGKSILDTFKLLN